MKSKANGIESIAIRRAVVADSDKVRYRVYSNPREFIAVIAQSALMAVKVSGVAKPHKIVRDLPTEGIAIEAKKMAAVDPKAIKVALPIEKSEREKQLVAEMAAQRNMDEEKQASFKPMNIADLQHNGSPRARILPPELLSEIIEQHSKATMPPPVPPEPLEEIVPAPIVQPEPEQVPEPEPQPEISTEEKLLQMADETLPSVAPAPAATAAAPDTLSPEEVAKLLNE